MWLGLAGRVYSAWGLGKLHISKELDGGAGDTYITKWLYFIDVLSTVHTNHPFQVNSIHI